MRSQNGCKGTQQRTLQQTQNGHDKFFLKPCIVRTPIPCVSNIPNKMSEYSTHTRHFSSTFSMESTYSKKRRKNSCDMQTTLPIKNPTAKLLWNLRIIMVPPMDRTINMAADQKEAKPSDMFRVEVTTRLMSIIIPDRAKIAYLTKKNRGEIGYEPRETHISVFQKERRTTNLQLTFETSLRNRHSRCTWCTVTFGFLTTTCLLFCSFQDKDVSKENSSLI